MGLAALMAVVFSVVGVSCKDSKQTRENDCRASKGCPARHVCALGGCIPLIPDEPEVMWKSEIAAQSGDSEKSWSPRPAFGDALLDAPLCSNIEKNTLEKQKGGVISIQRGIAVYAFSTQDVKVVLQKKASSSMWQDYIKFQFPRTTLTGTPTYCISENLNGIKVLPNKVETGVAAVLNEAAPANVPFTVAMMERRPLGAQAASEISYDIVLPPVRTKDREDTSVLVLPLGTDVLSMEGPAAANQRLLQGYVAYYFNHTETRSKITIRMRLPTTPSLPLDFSQLKP